MPDATRSQIKKAGRTLRRCMRGDMDDQGEWEKALLLVLEHRAAHARPMLSANNSLRNFVQRLDLDAQVSQRLKRMTTILDKVVREPTLALDRMQDIGGCRVVVPDLVSVYQLAARVEETRGRKLIDSVDYVENPRSSGYRGVHLVAEYGRDPRPIEIQIRTRNMHVWATAVEEFSSTLGENYKQDGDTALHAYMECVARLFAHIDMYETIPKALLTERETLWTRVTQERQELSR